MFEEIYRFQIETTFNGQLAIDLVLQKNANNIPVHLIFMDVNMPVVDGLKATKTLKDLMKDSIISQAVIICVSAYDSKND